MLSLMIDYKNSIEELLVLEFSENQVWISSIPASCVDFFHIMDKRTRAVVPHVVASQKGRHRMVNAVAVYTF